MLRNTKPEENVVAAEDLTHILTQATEVAARVKAWSPTITALQMTRQALLTRNAEIANLLSQLQLRTLPRKLQHGAAKVLAEGHARLEVHSSCTKVVDACEADLALLKEVGPCVARVTCCLGFEGV